LGVVSLALTNFTWEYIYEPHFKNYPRFEHFCKMLREAYAKVSSDFLTVGLI